MLKRLFVVLAMLGVVLGMAVPSASATWTPLLPGCYLIGPGVSSGPGPTPDTAAIYYMGMSYSSPCNPAGHFRITVNLWEKVNGNWINPVSKSLYLRAGATSIPAGDLIFPCVHLAPVEGRVAYIIGTNFKWTLTPFFVGNCS